MKNTIYSWVLLCILLLQCSQYFAQVSIPVNGAPGAAANWVGWDPTRLFPLNVAHRGNFPILFQTNGMQNRMQIQAGNGFNTGRITMSDNMPAGFNARDRLHLYQTAASNVFTRFGHLGTGSALGDGASVGIDADGDFALIQYENRYFDLFSPSNATATNQVSRFRMMPNGQIFA